MDAVQVEKMIKGLGGKPTLENFIEQFGVFAQGPGGFLIIRNLILKLAVRGLIFDTKKVEINNKELNEFYDIYHLPENWKIDTILNTVKKDKYSIKRGPFGSAIKKSYFVPEGYKVYEQQNAIYNDFDRGSYYINEKKFNELKAFEIKAQDLIISCSGTVGKVAEAPQGMERGVINQALLKLSLNQEILLNDYFKIVFQAYFMDTPELRNLKGTAQKNMVSVKTLKSLPYPLPPLEEQKRIVAKVDELMALCDQLQAQQQQQANTLLKANTAAIRALLSTETTPAKILTQKHGNQKKQPESRPRSNNNLMENWQRIANNFHTLYGNTIPMPPGEGRKKKYFVGLENVNNLRKLILNLAVTGKIVSGFRDDKSTDELIDKIQSHRINLIDKGKLKNPKNLDPVIESDAPYKLPKQWKWVRLGDVFDVTSSKRVHAKDYVQAGVPFFRSKEIGELGRGKEVTTELYISQNQYSSFKNLPGFPLCGDLMLCSIGASIGNNWLCDNRSFYYKDGNITKIGNHKFSEMRYLKTFVDSDVLWQQVTDSISGSAYNALTIIKIKNLYYPLPPLEEQKRIVAKVDQLMALCDQLEQQLATAYGDAEKLINATIKRLVA